MSQTSLIDQIAQRVEHLLLRHEELQRTNALLAKQVQELTQERDLLKSRLGAARHRIDALIDRLPQGAEVNTKDNA
jgi:cell division protein ZapB